jgi:hypothetical protein
VLQRTARGATHHENWYQDTGENPVDNSVVPKEKTKKQSQNKLTR